MSGHTLPLPRCDAWKRKRKRKGAKGVRAARAAWLSCPMKNARAGAGAGVARMARDCDMCDGLGVLADMCDVTETEPCRYCKGTGIALFRFDGPRVTPRLIDLNRGTWDA